MKRAPYMFYIELLCLYVATAKNCYTREYWEEPHCFVGGCFRVSAADRAAEEMGVDVCDELDAAVNGAPQ